MLSHRNIDKNTDPVCCWLGIEHLWDVFQSTVVKYSCESIRGELLSVVQVRYSYCSYKMICS